MSALISNINIVDFILAFMEVGLSYIITCNTIIERKLLKKRDLVLFIIVALINGFLLAINRKITFISYTMMLFCVMVTTLTIRIVKKCELISILGIVFLYYLSISFFELFFAFMSMMFLGQRFDQTVYHFADSIWKNAFYFISDIFICLIVYIFNRKQKGNYIDFSPLKKVLIIIDIMLYIVFRQYLSMMDNVSLKEPEMLGTEMGLSLLVIISVVGLSCTIYLKYCMVQDEKRNYLVRDEVYKKNYEDIDQMLKISGQRLHDMKNHFVVIKELCVQNNLSGIEEYVDDIYDEYFNQSFQEWTGNRIVDIILNQKKIIAERKGIEFNLEVKKIPEIKLSDIEICSLLGNLLDNAIEACEKQREEARFIDVKMQAKKGFLFIKIKNSISSKPKIERGVFITSKKDKATHGYGLKSVNRIVKKYEGDISYTIEEETFEIRIYFYDMVVLSNRINKKGENLGGG